MNHIGLFEGIGGFSLAARWMGWETIAWCEWNEFGQKVLKHHFPKAQPHGDITKTDFTIYRGQCDIVTGGFPCQPYSLAGKRKGKADERHLWPEMLRAIREIQPTWVVGENVLGLVNWDGGLVFNEVQADLEAEGYEVFPYVLPAVSVNAPHRRDRIWFVAYSANNGHKNRHTKAGGEVECSESRGMQQFEGVGRERFTANPNSIGIQRQSINNNTSKKIRQGWKSIKEVRHIRHASTWQNFPTQSPIRFGDDGLSDRLDSITFPKWRNESIKAAGNAIVPQVAFQIFKTIKLYNEKL
jgi:DNA (cytosine-5)-methyltransferase 1